MNILKHTPALGARTLGAISASLAFAGGALAAEEGGGGGMPQLDPSSFPSQIFWLVVSFAILFLLMWKVALPRVGEVIEQRQQKVSADLDRAEKLKAEVEQISADYEKLLSDARSEANEEIRKVEASIKTSQEKKLHNHDTQIAVMISEAEERIASARKAAMEEIRDVATDAAMSAVEKLIGQSPDKKAVTKAVETAAKGA